MSTVLLHRCRCRIFHKKTLCLGAKSGRVAFGDKVDVWFVAIPLAFLTVVAAQGEWQNDSRNERHG
jgi:hypothetical protein